MNLRSITFGALFLGLLGTQPSTACEETSGDLKDYSRSYILEGNKTLCTMTDQHAPNITAITPLENRKMWNLHPITALGFFAALDGILMIPRSVAVCSFYVRWPLQTIVGLPILCAAHNLYEYNRKSKQKLRLEKEYSDSKMEQLKSEACGETARDLEYFSTSYIPESNKTLCAQTDQPVPNITAITPLEKTKIWNLHPKTVCALWGVAEGIVTIPLSALHICCIIDYPLIATFALPILFTIKSIDYYDIFLKKNLKIEKQCSNSEKQSNANDFKEQLTLIQHLDNISCLRITRHFINIISLINQLNETRNRD